MKRAKLRRWVIALLLLLALLVGLLVVLLVATNRDKEIPPKGPGASAPVSEYSGDVSNEKIAPETTQPEATETKAAEAEATEPAETIPQDIVIGESAPKETQTPDVTIETKYATLCYPGQWEDKLHVETVNLDFGTDVIFFAKIEGAKYWLFTVHFGGAEGIPVGVLDTAMGYAIDVTIEMSEYIPEDSWSTENKDLFSAMQEAMNYLMNKLSQTPGFEG